MTDEQVETARACLASTYDNESFPAIVGRLIAAGFERYAVDFCRGTQTLYLPDGDSLVLQSGTATPPIGKDFDRPALQAAIREAQQYATGYSYAGFREKAMRAGCVGYAVSFPGRRAVYSARTAETHVEHFPD